MLIRISIHKQKRIFFVFPYVHQLVVRFKLTNYLHRRRRVERERERERDDSTVTHVRVSNKEMMKKWII